MKRRQHLRLLFELHRATHDVIAHLGKTGLSSHAEAIVLALLDERQAAGISDIHRAFGHRRSTLTNVVDRLVEHGLVTREPASDDRRSTVIRPTAEGAKVARRIHERLSAIEAEALRGRTEREIENAREILGSLTRTPAGH